MRRVATAIAALLAASAGLVFVAPTAHAANPDIVVTTSVDVIDPVDGVLSLREAVSLANVTVGANTVVLTAGTTYPLTICDGLPTEEDANASGDLDATNPAGLTITGNGATVVQACQAADQERILESGGGPLAVSGATMSGGHGTPVGAVEAAESLTFLGVTVDGTVVADVPPADPVEPTAVDVAGSALVVDSTIDGTRGASGLQVSASATITGSTISNNATASSQSVGGARLRGPAFVSNTLVRANLGGVWGGLVVEQAATLSDVHIMGNDAFNVSSAAVAGIGSKSAEPVVIDHSLIEGNGVSPGSPTAGIGGILAVNLQLVDSILRGNVGRDVGGGILRDATVTRTSIVDNGWLDAQGGSFFGGVVGSGVITDSVIAGNAGKVGGGVTFSDSGLEIRRTTVTANRAERGGGIALIAEQYGYAKSLVVHESTIVANQATERADEVVGEVWAGTMPTAMTVRSSVIGSSAPTSACAIDHRIAVGSEGHNFDADGTCGVHASTDTSAGGNPVLSALGPHGGAVDSMVPLPQSPLVDRVATDQVGCAGPAANGLVAPQGPSCDIGAAEAPVPDGRYHPMSPARVLDTRTGLGFAGRVGQDPRLLKVGGSNGIPASATAVVMNVTATGSTASSFLTVWGARRPAPVAASVNFGAGETRNNLTTVRLGRGAAIALSSAVGATDVVADVVGWYDDGSSPGDGFTPTSPTRILDSRTGLGFGGPVGQTPRDLTVAGAAGVPADATAVVVDVTVTASTAPSYLTVWPSGQPRPVASASNFAPGETLDLAVMARVGAGGNLSFFSAQGSTQVVADVVGYFTPPASATLGAAFHPVATTRMADSRSDFNLLGPVNPTPSALNLSVGVPKGWAGGPTAAVVGNLAVTQGSTASWLMVWPSGDPRPLAAVVVYGSGQTLNNLAVLVPRGGGTQFATSAGTVQVVIDAAGWYG